MSVVQPQSVGSICLFLLPQRGYLGAEEMDLLVLTLQEVTISQEHIQSPREYVQCENERGCGREDRSQRKVNINT